ncbi:XdhC family protein [Aliiroseovarius sp. F20344]|uniref:XdhC family protein n=1 Tax=Aliiroseovarius sp. F20344 TaxID=2926414 RepID=UPI001FF17166|nr:XdhC family protein [Aliiroseovarius sp. F20344]MCK0141988.1 XdhC family protein [Aliiroseovarius sp. F20344]
MAVPTLDASSVIEPIRQLAASDQPGVLAIITNIEGPSYRPLGAMMAVFGDKTRVGTLSSGCVEEDIALHAMDALTTGQQRTVLYGLGSPYKDIQLPCGGGLEITLIPRPDKAVLDTICDRHSNRQTTTLSVDLGTGAILITEGVATGRDADRFNICIEPELFFYVFGKGPEATTFAGLVQSAGYPNLLLSPDAETLTIATQAGCETRHLISAHFPDDLHPDAHSAILLFFHDHEWEPPILRQSIQSEAFFIGAQGSKRAAEMRKLELEALGVSQADLEQIKGPIGLIPSVRDARRLAVSVLADVLNER